MKNNGFTLAEVLITLVIIGVIAALTIPALINKTNEQDTVTSVKKAYTILSQAYQKTIAEEGETYVWLSDETDQIATETLGKLLVKHFNILENCGITTTGHCFPDVIYKRFNDDDHINFNQSTYYKLRLNDGMSLAICGWKDVHNTFGETLPLRNIIGYYNIDINGDKGPNIWGKDMFLFYITKYGVIPSGTPSDIMHPLSGCKTQGTGCTAWITTKNNMDYLRKNVSW